MGNLVYLGGAIAFVVVVSLLLLLRDRHPTSVVSEVEQFSKGLEALARRDAGPDGQVARQDRRR
ncbi:MAG: hypothetical protein ACRDYD_10715 [Acidimicrobiales bacterium]